MLCRWLCWDWECLHHQHQTCYLCQEELSLEDWQEGEHRQECMKRNKAALVSHRENDHLSCNKCSGKLREFSVSKFSIFVCNSGRSQCPSGKKNFSHGPTRTRTRFSCFLCDFHICNDCANNVCDEKRIENEKKIPTKIENLQSVVLSQGDEEEGLLDEMEHSEEAFKVQDDIPLIDENPSLDDVSLIVEKIKINRPKFLHQENLQAGFYFNPLAVDSPDIFKLRAPLVSCENILTPAISAELLRPKQI